MRFHLDPRFDCSNAWRVDGPTNKPADSAASGEATPSPPSGGKPAPLDFPVPRIEPIYDQEFFLALARCGKEVWNHWRAENRAKARQPYVTFEGVDFRKPANAVIGFSGFDFGHNANFRACKFGDGPNFLRDGEVDFRSGMAKFEDAVFGDFAMFSSGTFGEFADFLRCDLRRFRQLFRGDLRGQRRFLTCDLRERGRFFRRNLRRLGLLFLRDFQKRGEHYRREFRGKGPLFRRDLQGNGRLFRRDLRLSVRA